jgi:hypothetical protein
LKVGEEVVSANVTQIVDGLRVASTTSSGS